MLPVSRQKDYFADDRANTKRALMHTMRSERTSAARKCAAALGTAVGNSAAPEVQADALPTKFVPLSLRAPAEPAASAQPIDIRVEVQRGATIIAVTWPASAASECAAWMRELLR